VCSPDDSEELMRLPHVSQIVSYQAKLARFFHHLCRIKPLFQDCFTNCVISSQTCKIVSPIVSYQAIVSRLFQDCFKIVSPFVSYQAIVSRLFQDCFKIVSPIVSYQAKLARLTTNLKFFPCTTAYPIQKRFEMAFDGVE
jgi:hypothetical protein